MFYMLGSELDEKETVIHKDDLKGVSSLHMFLYCCLINMVQSDCSQRLLFFFVFFFLVFVKQTNKQISK